MIITAKFASVCPCCSIRIVAGSKVEWSKGTPAKHVTCVRSTGNVDASTRSTGNVERVTSRNTLSVRSSSRHSSFTRCEGWGSDNPHAPRHGHCSECAAMG